MQRWCYPEVMGQPQAVEGPVTASKGQRTPDAPIATEAVEGEVVDAPSTSRSRNGRWLPGKSANPRGRPNRGAAFEEWANTMVDKDEPSVQAIADDTKAPLIKRQAAKHVLRCMAEGFAKSGKPLAGDDLDRMLDRSLGKPMQPIDMTVVDETPLAALRERFAAILAASPDGAAVLAAVATKVGLEPKALPEAPGDPPEAGDLGAGVPPS